MNFIEQIKPISYLKSHTTEIVKSFERGEQGPLIITQNGEPKMVVLGIQEYQSFIEKAAFNKLVAMGNRQMAANEYVDGDDFIADLEKEGRE